MILSRTALGVSLADVLADAQRFGAGGTVLSRCTVDAAHVKPGDVYVAIVEADRDGHDQVALAVQRGAAAIVAERYVTVPVPLYVVDDSRQAYGVLCHALANFPSRRMITLGVTGYCGKTSVVSLVTSILRVAGLKVGWACSVGWFDGRRRYATAADEWQPQQVARHLARMEQNGCQAAVVECPRRALAEHRWAGVEFDVQIVTDLRPSLTNETLLPGYHVQTAVHRFLQQGKPDRLLCVNLDDGESGELTELVAGNVLTCGVRRAADVWGKVVERGPTEQTFLLTLDEDTVAVRTSVIGDWWVRNCLSAAAAAAGLGLPLPVIARGIEQVTTVPGRLERIVCGQPFQVFLDEASSHGRLAEMLRTLREVTEGKLICVFAPADRVPVGLRPQWGRVVEQLADTGILTTSHRSSGEARQLWDDVMDGYRRPARLHFIPNRRVAIRYALSQATAGDCVLIAGTHAARHSVSNGQAQVEDDHQTVYNILRTLLDEPNGCSVPGNDAVLIRFPKW